MVFQIAAVVAVIGFALWMGTISSRHFNNKRRLDRVVNF